ncbi:MAG: hypothetical protein QXH80_00560 [Candidatus Nanoarchaeia archaeon]
MKAQSPAEFIIVIFIFFLIVIFIFTSNLTNTKPEAEKIKEQGACIAAQGLATSLLKEPGQPASWNPGNLEVLGLTNGSQNFIQVTKWLDAQTLGFANLQNKTFPESNWLLTYDIYAFKLKAETCPSANNSAIMCRGTNFLNITANSTINSVLELNLFFPLTSVALYSALEPNDVAVATPAPEGTQVQLILNTNSTDEDKVDMGIVSAPDLIFIKKSDYRTEGGADLPMYLNDIKIFDSLGSGGSISGLNNYCNSQNNVLLVKSDENLLARFEILAW